MMLTSHAGVPASPMRLLEMLTDRFGVFEALAHSTIKLNRCTSADELSMEPQVAEAVLEFADDLRTALSASDAWAQTRGLVHDWDSAEYEDDAGERTGRRGRAGPSTAAARARQCVGRA